MSLRFADPAERHVLTAERALLDVEAGRVDRARHQRVDPDVVGAEVERHRPGERFDPALGGVVGRERPVGTRRATRAHVDDAAATGLGHDPRCPVRAQEVTGEVDVDDPAPPGLVGFEEVEHRRDESGVVDQDVDRAVRRDDVRRTSRRPAHRSTRRRSLRLPDPPDATIDGDHGRRRHRHRCR